MPGSPLITLLYLRHNVSHAVCGAMFGVSADISENSFHEVVAVLREVRPAERFDAQKKWTKREPSWRPDTLDQVLVDSFETLVCRQSLPDKQRKFYSDKKTIVQKRHTIKSQKASCHADLGYVGVPKRLLSHKRS